jgi:hypothetical protein
MNKALAVREYKNLKARLNQRFRNLVIFIGDEEYQCDLYRAANKLGLKMEDIAAALVDNAGVWTTDAFRVEKR